MQNNDEKINIRMVLRNDLARRFSALKKILGFRTNSATLIHLINSAYTKESKKRGEA